MTDPRFYDAASGLLTREAFSFMVDHQLEHAKRAQEFMTLVVFLVERRWRERVMERDWRERAIAADDWIVKEMARLIRHAVRSTDLLARTASGAVSLLLVGIDGAGAGGVIERVNVHLRRYRATPTLQISVGSACCPTDAVRADELIQTARGRAVRASASSTADSINGARLDPEHPASGKEPAGAAHAASEARTPTPFVERRRSPTPRSMREH
jgi:GGDEF domain-containing protein